MYAYCGWKAEPFKDLRARLLAAPKLAGAKADIETYFDRGPRYGADEAKKRADQKAKGEKPSRVGYFAHPLLAAAVDPRHAALR